MIEVWSLPGPVSLVARVAAEVIDGRQCVPIGEVPSGFRRAVEDELAARQLRLRVVYDDPELDPAALLRREADIPQPVARFPEGVWWVDGVTNNRAEGWKAVVAAMGEAMRHEPPQRRTVLIVPLPVGSLPMAGLDISVLKAAALGRLDLEVAARYAAASMEYRGISANLRVELAVEMASTLLPGAAALDVLGHWMTAPEEALCDPERFAAHARAMGAELTLPEFEIWRIQHAVLLREIERERLSIVVANRGRWRLPYDAPAADGRPPKRVHAAELLELKHLYQQVRQLGEPPRAPIVQRIQMLRDLRNALSHFEYVSLADVRALEDGIR